MAEITGLSARTLRAYQRDLGPEIWESRQNAALTEYEWKPGTPEEQNIPEGHFPDYVDGRIKILRRLPNSYRSHFRKAPRGMMRKVNAGLNARNSPRFRGGETQRRGRLFYDNARAAQRRMQQCSEGDWFYHLPYHLETLPDGSEMPGVRTSRCGAALWNQHRYVNRQLHTG